MCLYPTIAKNRKYTATKKNGGNIPPVTDIRATYVAIGCGKCMECRKQKARAWQVRLHEEIRTGGKAEFVTLTFSNEAYEKLNREVGEEITGYDRDNEIATIAVRRFLERWRFKHKTSVKHWLITELGHEGTENIHMHGLIWTENKEEIEKIWNSEKAQYGYVFMGDYVNEKTVNYIIKYVTKPDKDHETFKPKILASPGIGKGYISRQDAKQNKYKKGDTREYYQTRQGVKLNLPVYYRNKIYTEEEREKLWMEKLDKQERYVLGKQVSTKDGEEAYYRMLKQARAKNKRLGYGDDSKNWDRQKYERQRREIMNAKRLDGYNND